MNADSQGNVAKVYSEEWANAICDVSRMLLQDRYRLVHGLPDIIRINPIFGAALGEKLAADDNEGLVIRLASMSGELLQAHEDTAFMIAQAIAVRPTGFNSSGSAASICKQLPVYAEFNLDKAIQLAKDILIETRWAHVPGIIAEQIGKIARIAHESGFQEQPRNPAYDLAYAIIKRSPSAIGKVLGNFPILASIDSNEAIELVEGLINFQTKQQHIRRNNFENIAKQLTAIASFDSDRAFTIMDELYNYQDPPEKHSPDPPGVITIPDEDPYQHVQKEIVNQIGSMAKYDEEKAFAFAEKFTNDPQKPWLWEIVYHQIPLLVQVNAQRTLDLCENFSQGNSGHDWRAFVPALVALSRKTKSSRIYAMVDRLIEEGDDGAIGQLTDELQNFRGVPKSVRENWADKIYSRASKMGHTYIDVDAAMQKVTSVSSRSANQARERMASVLETMDFKF